MTEFETTLQASPIDPPDSRQSLATIARNTSKMISAQLLIKVFSFAFGIYVVRRLGAAEFGQYSAAMAYAFILAMFTELGTSTLSVREMARKPETVSWMVPNIILIRAILSIAMIAGVTLSAKILGKTPDMVLGIFIASFGLLLYAFQGPLDATLIAKERLDYSSVLTLFNQIIFILLGSLALIFKAGYIGLLLASLSGVLVMGLSSVYVIKYKLKISFDRPDLKRWWPLLVASFPFGVIGIVTEFSQRFDTVFMSFILTYTAVGYFNVSLDLPLATMLLAQSLGLAMFPTMVREYNSGAGSIQKTIQRACRYLLMIALPLSIGGMLVSNRLIPLVYGESYVQAAPVFSVIIWSLPFMFLAEVLGRACTTMHLEKIAARYFVLNSIFNIVLAILLIPKFGVMGAAAAMVIGRFTNVLLDILILKPSLVFNGNVMPMLRVIFAGIFMGVCLWMIKAIPFWLLMDGKIALFFIILSGGILYLIGIFLFRAVTSGEVGFVTSSVKARISKIMPKRIY
jgi:O-antigen/teichoic acid export membrane protein